MPDLKSGLGKPILVTGTTGYVGGRLAPRLLDAGYRVRAVGRSADKIRCRPWGSHPNLEIAQADAFDEPAMLRAAKGCGVAYYLIHSMRPGARDFAGADKRAAAIFARACALGDVERIIYLGGLGEESDELSEHLRSRLETARTLQAGPVPVTFLRAAMIIGSGSASFEILRYLADRLPVMVAPRWVRTKSQPIAISNVLGYLQGCLTEPRTAGRTFGVCGPTTCAYGDLFHIYCRAAGLRKRLIIPVPVLSPRLSSLWVNLITPVPAALARPLIEGLKNEACCAENEIRALIPQELLSCEEAIALATKKVRERQVETCWHDAGHVNPPEWATCGDAPYAGGTVYECGYKVRVRATPEELFEPVRRIGGERGWYFGDLLWGLRGFMDTLVGGVGADRGRRSPEELRVGDAVDFFRVLALDPPGRLLLAAEMRVPGEAVLEFTLIPVKEGDAPETELRMNARFVPRGLLGLAYWWSVYPLHGLVFGGMLRRIAAAAGKPLTAKPERFTPVRPQTCALR